MSDLLRQLDELQDQAQTLVGDIARDASYADLHTKALAMLLSIVNLRNSAAQNQVASPGVPRGHPPSTSHDDITAEIARVSRKLPRWARNQTQINSRILTLFLEIRRDGHSRITEDDLSQAYGDASEFYRNFMQMKAIAPNNHAKVFDVLNSVITIWEPVKHLVDDYERTVLDLAPSSDASTNGYGNEMRGFDMERKLNSVGKQAFVEQYELFQRFAAGSISREDAIAKLVDQGVSNEAGAAIRVGNAKLIFENAWESEALRLVLASKRLHHTILSEARSLLGARG